MNSMASKIPDLKVAPAPGEREPERQPLHARMDDHQPPGRKSLASRLTRRFFQILLPVLVIAAGLGGFQYMKATKPVVPTRKAKPNVFAVNSVPVSFGTVQPQIRLFGSTVAGRKVDIRSLVAGQIVATSENLRDGGQIASGETIISIDPFNFKSALEEVEAMAAETASKIKEFEASLAVERGNVTFVREQVKLAEIDLNRAEPLSRRGAVTERVVDERKLVLNQRRQTVAQMENNVKVWEARIAQQKAALKRLEATRRVAAQRLAETTLVAPFNAYVTEVGAQVGRIVGVNDRVATLIDRDWIEVAFTVTDRQFGRLVAGRDGIEGRKVEVRWNVGEKPLVYSGLIDRVGASVSSEAGGVQLYARVDKPASGVGLRPGAFVEVLVPDTAFSEVARLPSTAVFDRDKVYAIKDGKLVARKINIVSTSGSDVLVRGELKAGDQVMTTRLSLPGDGVQVKQVNERNSAAGGRADGNGEASEVKSQTGAAVKPQAKTGGKRDGQ